MLSKSFPSNYSNEYLWKVKMLSPGAYPLRKMACFNMASQSSKVQLTPPTGNIYGI